MTITILTIFPDMVREIMSYGVVGQAVKKGVLQITSVDLRDYATDKHRSVDDKPFGGGPGMVLRVDIIDRALQALEATSDKPSSRAQVFDSEVAQTRGAEGRQATSKRIILMSASGPQFIQQKAEEYSKLDHLILISGRYEGVDERVREHLVDEELSIGPYVLSGGEIPAMVVADAVARLVPGVVGDPESLVNESFATSDKRQAFVPSSGLRLRSRSDSRSRGATSDKQEVRPPRSKSSSPRTQTEGLRGILYPEAKPRTESHLIRPIHPTRQAAGLSGAGVKMDFPQYTKPEEYRGWEVPAILRSGNHEEIQKWREKHRKRQLANSE